MNYDLPSSSSRAPVWPEPFNTARPSELRAPFHLKKVQCADWNRDGKKLATGGSERVICLWDVHHSRGSAELEFKGHTDTVDTIRWNPTSSEQLASSGTDCSVRFWDARKGNATHTFTVGDENLSLSWAPDGQALVVCDRSDTVTVFDVRKNAVARTFKVPEVSDAIVVAGSNGGAAQLYVAGGLPTGSVEVYSMAPDAKGQLPLLRSVRAHTSWCHSLSYDKSRNRVVVGSADGLISLWDTEELCCMGTLMSTDMHQANRTSVSHDGRFLAAGFPGSLEIFSLDSLQTVYRLPVPRSGLEVTAVAWSPVANLLSYSMGPDEEQDSGVRRDHGPAASLYLLTNIDRGSER